MAAACLVGVPARAQPTFKEPERYRPSAEERQAIEARLEELARAIAALPRDETKRDALAEVAVYHKAATWTLRLGEFFEKKDVAATLDVLARGLERARHLADGRRPWIEGAGSRALGFVSKVDDSIQPYAVVLPSGFNPDRSADPRARLDVVLHGRGATLSEVRFLQAHDRKKIAPGDAPGVVTLHVYGRGNNAYRWAGETDVFEAVEAVKRNFPIDERKVVLRGFSMGGAGAWHLGLHHPSLWSSVEAGAGFSETKTYAKLGAIPDYQEKALRIYDAVDAAANACNVPIAGYGGENDPQRQAAIHIEEALRRLGYTFKTEGLVTRGADIDFLRVVGAKMGHAVDPASAKILNAFHDEHAEHGAALTPRRIRFVASTLKYNRAAWLAIEQMKEHYLQASVDAEVEAKRVVVHKAENIAVLSVDRHVGEAIVLGAQEFPLESAAKGLLPNVYFRFAGNEWRQLDYEASRAFQENTERGKRRNLQGPIDDAFTGAFLCVRGTGKPWNPHVQRWADERLTRFDDDWRRWMRGEVRIKDDVAITQEDIENHHLILFGDPGSNGVLTGVLKELPLTWTPQELGLGGTYRAADHAPALIAPNPLNPHRYVVINTGHTFGAREFAGTNALLFPHLGDYAVFRVDREGGEVKASGFFNEKWERPAK
jgi:dienelactone hydrolase